MATALPDLGAAVMLQLKASAEIMTLVTNRIYLEWPANLIVPDAEGKYLNAILISSGKGGPGDIGLTVQDERVDIMCFGANRKTAYDIWRAVDWYLLGHAGNVKTSFTRANCRVMTAAREGGPLRLVEPDMGNWPYTMGPYRFKYTGSTNV